MAKFKALRPVLKPVLSNALKGGKSSLSRFFTRFDAPAKSYIQLSSPITLSGDWEIRVDIYTNDNTLSVISSFDDNDNKFQIFITPSGLVQYSNKVAGVTVDRIGTVAVNTNKFESVTISKSGVNLSIAYSSSVTVDNFTIIDQPVKIDALAQQNNFLYFNGIIANVKIEDAGNLVLDMPIDGNYSPISNVVIDKSSSGNNGTFVNVSAGDSQFYTFNRGLNGYLGENLITQDIWENPQGGVVPAWTYDATANTWSLDGDGSAQVLTPLLAPNISDVFRIETPVLAFTAKTAGGQLTDVQAFGNRTSQTGIYSNNYNLSDVVRVQYKRASGGQEIDVTIAKPEVREFLGLS